MKKIVSLISLLSFGVQAQSFFNPLSIIKTNNLILRNCSQSDAHDLFEVHSDPEVINYTPMELDANPARTLYWIEWRLKRQSHNKPAPWVIEHKADKKAIGLCGFYTFNTTNQCADLMITCNRKYDKSIMIEAVDAVMHYGFTHMGLNRINFYIHPKDQTMISLCTHYESRGLKRVGIIPDCLYYQDAFWDRILYCMLKKEFVLQPF